MDTGNYRIAIRFSHNAAGGVAYLPIELTVTAPVSVPQSDFIPYPSSLILSCYPNPFNSTVVVSCQLSVAGWMTLKLYDLDGRLVQTLIEGWQEAGEQRVVLNGDGFSSGVYMIKGEARGKVATGAVRLAK
jgi:hypothetical protein